MKDRVNGSLSKHKLSQPGGAPHCDVKLLRAISLPTASIQTQNFASRLADYFPRLLHHIYKGKLLISSAMVHAGGLMAGTENSSVSLQNHVTPLPRRLCR